MSYKTILVHLDESPRLAERVRLAAALALADQGHLIGVALTGIARLAYRDGHIDEQDPHLALHLSLLRERAGRALAGFAAQLDALGLRSHEQHVVDDDAGTGLSLQARHADLVVIGQRQPGRGGALLGDLAGHVLLHGGRPLLVVPDSGASRVPLERVLVAWDGGREAARALTAALPLLRRAAQVDLAVFAPAEPGAGDAAADAAVVAHLRRHGVAVELLARPAPAPGLLRHPDPVGAALLALAAERHSDLLVMGGYGHSRLREILLGGVTRTLLEQATLPLLIAH
ncbi:universal stress protein [Rugamonas rubra]|uniref:Nucleotide-binding universal stress protein, UspA family n=1 Tax=Rugamonas rubra TaxID=758825 RepID=A0A1I4NGZ3_9BURK|nr:universal stress protein [Rugamonas rubra]SFM14567.1 Nucleotide-binding universal stress protein, UspA family [Rugamonas rubra]